MTAMSGELPGIGAHPIRILERYLRTDLSYLVRGGFWLAMGHGVSVVSAFGLAILFANFLPKETYGTYKYVLSFIAIFSIATLPGINTYLAQAVARGKEGTLKSAFRYKVRWGILGGGAALLMSAYYAVQGNLEFASAFLAGALTLPFMDSLSIYNVYLQAKKLFKTAVSYFTVSQIITTAVLAAALVFTRDLVVVLVAYFASWTLIRLFFFLRTLKRFPPNAEEDRAAFSYGAHLSLIGVTAIVASNLDSLLLFQYLGPVEVAVYAFALAPIEQIRGLFKNISPLAVPKLANRTFREINELLIMRLGILTTLGITIAGTYIAFAPLFFTLLFPQYMESVFISQLLAGLIAIRLPETFFAALGESKMSVMPKSWLYWSALPQGVMIALLIALVPFYGIYGIIIGKYVSLIAGFGVNIVQWRLLSARNP